MKQTTINPWLDRFRTLLVEFLLLGPVKIFWIKHTSWNPRYGLTQHVKFKWYFTSCIRPYLGFQDDFFGFCFIFHLFAVRCSDDRVTRTSCLKRWVVAKNTIPRLISCMLSYLLESIETTLHWQLNSRVVWVRIPVWSRRTCGSIKPLSNV